MQSIFNSSNLAVPSFIIGRADGILAPVNSGRIVSHNLSGNRLEFSGDRMICNRFLLAGIVLFMLVQGASAAVIFSDGFENGYYGWSAACLNDGSGSGKVTSPVREGNYSYKFVVKPGITCWNTERSEILLRNTSNTGYSGKMPNEIEGDHYYYSWSTYFPDEFTDTHTWQVLHQWHEAYGLSPPLSLTINSAQDPHRISFTIVSGNTTSDGSYQYKEYEIPLTALTRNVWHDWIFNISWSANYAGSVEVWHKLSTENDYVMVLSRHNIPTLQRMTDGRAVRIAERHIGLYRGTATTNQTVYQDAYEIRTTFSRSDIYSAPIITDYNNTKTNDKSTSLDINTSESVTFSASANQTITTWKWYKDDIIADVNASSFNISWGSTGIHTLRVNGTNKNGATKTNTWTITINSLSSIFGRGGNAWDAVGTLSNVYIEDSKIKLGFWGENFDDGLYDWTTSSGNVTVSNGKLNMYGTSGKAAILKTIGNHSDVAMFATWTETTADKPKEFVIRTDISRSSIDSGYWVSFLSDGNGAWIFQYNGTAWIYQNKSGTFPRTNNATSYCIEKGYGSTFKVYCSHISYANALGSAPVSQGTDTQFAYGNTIQLKALFNSSVLTDIVTWDNLRIITLDSSGNLINSGSKTVYYDAGVNNKTNSIRINATTPAKTNYTISYRQKNTGSWIPIGGTYTGNQTLYISGTKYQDTEINFTLFGNNTSFPEIERIEFIKEQLPEVNIYPRYDINENGIVDIDDLLIQSQYFNRIVSIPYPRYDVNMDGLVNILDSRIVAQHFLT